VVKEAMRLHLVTPVLIPHKAIEDGIEIGGYAVPKGCTVIFNAWAMMRDPAAWERPEEFMPERFLGTVAEVDFKGKDYATSSSRSGPAGGSAPACRWRSASCRTS
jgi:cytochrome P450